MEHKWKKKSLSMERRSNSIYSIAVFILTVFLASCDNNPEVNYSSIDGFYSCEEGSAHAGIRKYILEIDKVSSQDNTYIIANFHNLGDNEFLYAEYLQDTLYIRNQVVSVFFVNGKGKVYDDFKRIELFYTADDGVQELGYSAVLVR